MGRFFISRMIRLLWVILLPLLSLLSLAACATGDQTDPDRLESFRFDSQYLGKSMGLKVYLPAAYDPALTYPVLYFLPDGGGSEYTVIQEYEIGIAADKLVAEDKIRPLIIVAVDTDRSFGLNSADTFSSFETSSGKGFDVGRYEDYIIEEVIPLIDRRYATDASRGGRMIGGYSAGGFASLYLAFSHPDLFCKAGGHSPSLFVADFPDKSISDWLYPDEATRDRRDPLHLAQTRDLTGLQVYLDTGATDVNVEGCASLHKLLLEQGIASENHLFFGTHSRTYCRQYMADYLVFYGSSVP